MRTHVPAGTATDGPFALSVAMRHPALRILELPAGGAAEVATGGHEVIVLPIAGSCTVEGAGHRMRLRGRESVFAAVSDFCYLPPEETVGVSSSEGGRFALAGAPATRSLPMRYGDAGGVSVELRGAGACSRQVNNIAVAGGFACDRLMVVEVLTPGGNWSSYPPHKHDEHTADESELEEIYYFEVAGDGPGYQRVYGTPDRPIDLLAEVRTGDAVLVPHGWHGPSMAAPGYDLYYLNVMAGPHPERAWRFVDDPVHHWIRDTWPDQPVDPRLPLTGA
jgi:5-deoxy-glucuronate isomerase